MPTGTAFDAAQLLAGNPQRFLALLSPAKYGVGKTRLLACIVNAARDGGPHSDLHHHGGRAGLPAQRLRAERRGVL